MGTIYFLRASCGSVRPFAESSINWPSRFSLVSSFFALTTHQVTVFRYQGDCAWNVFQAAGLFRSFYS